MKTVYFEPDFFYTDNKKDLEFSDYLKNCCGEEKDFSVIRRWIDFVKNGLNIKFRDNGELLKTALQHGNYDIAAYLTDHLEYDDCYVYHIISNSLYFFNFSGDPEYELRLCFLFDKFTDHEMWSSILTRRDVVRGYDNFNKDLKPYEETILYRLDNLKSK